MKKVLTMVFLAAVAGSASAHAQGFCWNGLLAGNYAFTITGQILAGPTEGPVSGVAMTNFDGQGNLTQVDHVLHNGMLPAVAWRPGSGTYSVNADCTGNAMVNFTDGSPSLTIYFTLTSLGAEICEVVSNANTSITAIGIRRD